MESTKEKETESDGKDKPFTENTPLFSRMTKVCHALMFLYGAAYWIQIGVFPVCICIFYCKKKSQSR